MPKDFGRFFSRIKGRKVSFFRRIWLNFWFKKITCCLYQGGTVRHSTVKRKLKKQDADLVAVPTKYTRKLEVDERIRAFEVDGETVPYLACNLCQTIFGLSLIQTRKPGLIKAV